MKETRGEKSRDTVRLNKKKQCQGQRTESRVEQEYIVIFFGVRVASSWKIFGKERGKKKKEIFGKERCKTNTEKLQGLTVGSGFSSWPC